MAYKVISPFADLQDKSKAFPDGRVYAVGDAFPATKRNISEERIVQLTNRKNALGRAVIAEVLETPSKGADKNGHDNGIKPSKGTTGNKKYG